tara:strand:+ start:287 stop:544 length:258 start_codon:yes stop_codon:yes gene_type:complete
MVWISKTIIILLSLLFFSTKLLSNELNDYEQMYFNYIDLNNDNQISLSEIEQSINIVFQITDYNQDGFLSKSEINELKNIIDSLR